MINFSEFCEVLDVKSEYGFFIEEHGQDIPFEYDANDINIQWAKNLLKIESSFYDTQLGQKFKSILEKYVICHDKFMETRGKGEM